MESEKQEIFDSISDYCINSLVRKVVYRIQRVPKDAMITGDDSVLKSFWEEVCVQVQDVKFDNWPLVEEFILGWSMDIFESLPPAMQELLSYQACDYYNKKYEINTIYTELASEFITAKVIEYAGDYTNERIEKYLESYYDDY